MPYSDPERRRAYGRDWMKRNPERAREAMRRWRAAHPEAHRAARDEWDRAHAESSRLRRQRYRLRHPEIRRLIGQTRRAREAGAAGSYTAAEWIALVTEYGSRCAYCRALAPLQPDHRVPLARGGTNHIDNILPACGACNRRKHTMTEEEFRARLASERDRDLQFD
jgi:5-methylcytosine-specific restriction endonuclease McrA